MNHVRELLSVALLDQHLSSNQDQKLPENTKGLARGYVDIENGVAVHSDFKADRNFIYVGKF